MRKKTGLVFLLWLLSGLSLEAEEYQELPILDEDREHWSFMPIERPPLPVVKHADWPQNPIDFFVLKKLNDVGINPMPEAEHRALVRRAHLDLTGLLPSYDEVVADQSYVELIDQLLASPRFGERQAQHWMDLARFAETDGFEHDKVRATAWKYRDWVISAFNSNLPYDEFVMQQLAADEISPDSDQTPTMFCLAGPDMPDINSQIERRHSLLNELTSTVGAVFMGLQVGCAPVSYTHLTLPTKA